MFVERVHENEMSLSIREKARRGALYSLVLSALTVNCVKYTPASSRIGQKVLLPLPFSVGLMQKAEAV